MQREDRNWERDTQRRSDEADADRAFRLEQWRREQEAAGDPTDVRAVPVPGTDYVVPMSGRKAMGTLPAQRPPAPGMTQEDVAAARAMGGNVRVPLPGGGQVDFPAPAPQMVKVTNPLGQVVDFPEGYELPEGWTALKRAGTGIKEPAAAAQAAPPRPAADGARVSPEGNKYKPTN